MVLFLPHLWLLSQSTGFPESLCWLHASLRDSALYLNVSVCTLSPRLQSSLNSLGSPFLLPACPCSAFQQYTFLWIEPDPSECRSYPFRNCGYASPRLIRVLESASNILAMLRFVYWETWWPCCCLTCQVLWLAGTCWKHLWL